MCRLFLQIGQMDTGHAYNEYLASCEDYKGRNKLDVHEKNELKIFDHKDGYGFAFIKNDHFEVRRYSEPIIERNPIADWEKTKTSVLLAHARRASPNIRVSLQNNHPFYWYNGDEYIFAHNGTIRSQISNFNQQKFFLRGSTDSEKYFYALLTAMGQNEWQMSKEIANSILENWDYTGANFILSSPRKAWIRVYYRTSPKYYTMKLYKLEDSIVVSSSYLPSLGEPTELLTNDTLVEIDIESKQYYYLV